MQPAQNESEFPVGTLLDNRYEVISPLGRGACGVVYKVRQVLLNKEFALKSLSKDSVNDLSLVRFQREAQACFSLNHPSIIKVHDFGLTSDGLPFLVMELLNGETLTDRIGRTGPLPIEETVDIIIQACFGLAYAHENGVVHRDIKSSNIMLMKNLPVGREGSVKIVDLGIAKFTVQGDNQLTLTRTGEVFGSPLYMSPEQCGGLQTDQRTDIYSLGCVFFECLTGAPPFRAPDVLSTMIKHQTESTPSLKEASLGRNFPKGLELIISKMLAKDLGERYQNIAQVVADLGKFKRGEPLKATEGKTGAGIKNNKSIVGAGLAVAIVASILIVGFLSLSLGVLFLNFSKSPLKPQNESAPVEASVISQLFDTRFVKPLPPNELVKILQDAKLNGKLLLYGCHITVDDFKQIGACKNLTMIGMEQCELENDGFAALSKLPIENLDLSLSSVNNHGVELVSRIKSLKMLNISQSQVDDDGVSTSVCKMRNLTRLELDHVHINNVTLEKLATLPKLDSLSIGACTMISSIGLIYLEKTKIKDLNIDNTFIDDSGVESLKRMPLTHISLVDTRISLTGLEQLCATNGVHRDIRLSAKQCADPQVHAILSRHPGIRFVQPNRAGSD